MSKLKTMEKVVLQILEEKPATRKDDYVLMLEVCNKLCPDVLYHEFRTALYCHNALKIPSWETVSRCRRKIQAKRPDLDERETRKRRNEEEELYREYART